MKKTAFLFFAMFLLVSALAQPSMLDTTAINFDLEYVDWSKVQIEGTAKSYQSYLRSYPRGIYAAEAKHQIVQLYKKDKEAWEMVCLRMNQAKSTLEKVDVYLAYLNQFPLQEHTVFRNQAEQRLDSLASLINEPFLYSNSIAPNKVEIIGKQLDSCLLKDFVLFFNNHQLSPSDYLAHWYIPSERVDVEILELSFLKPGSYTFQLSCNLKHKINGFIVTESWPSVRLYGAEDILYICVAGGTPPYELQFFVNGKATKKKQSYSNWKIPLTDFIFQQAKRQNIQVLVHDSRGVKLGKVSIKLQSKWEKFGTWINEFNPHFQFSWKQHSMWIWIILVLIVAMLIIRREFSKEAT